VNRLDVGHFQTLESLELTKVNVASLAQLKLVSAQLEFLKVNYSLSSFAELLVYALRNDEEEQEEDEEEEEEEEEDSQKTAERLDISTEDVRLLPPPDSWKSLVELDCSHNSIPRLDSSLRGLTNIEVFDASFNQIRKFQNLEQMTRLRSLDLSFNLITSAWDAINTIGNIQSLSLRSNQLDSVQGLEKLLSLEYLDLRENCLWDLSELACLAELPCLNSLYLEGNPVSLSDVCISLLPFAFCVFSLP